MTAPPDRLRVVHFTDPAGASDRLWGKENVIISLMEAQRASGRVDPELVTFAPGLLGDRIRAAGFHVHTLGQRHQRISIPALRLFQDILAAGATPVVHTHEYKANIVARLARVMGAPMRQLISTCHGWVDHSLQLDTYYMLDRLSAIASDAVTVTDPAMISLFPPFRPRRLLFVQNGIPQRPVPTTAQRLAARARLNLPPDATVVGSLGRLTKNKGILDILAAARRTQNSGIIWAIAGSGPLADDVTRCDIPNVRFVAYQPDSVKYLAALDVYLQASYFEGLSISLLEAMRAGLPSIATKAGATEFAIRDSRESVLVDAGNIEAIVRAASCFRADDTLRMVLGAAARRRFDEAFAIELQQEAFMKLYIA